MNHTLFITRAARALALSAATLLFLLVMTDTTRSQVDRSKQPPADPPPTAAFPSFEEFTLTNGLRVFLVHDDRPLVTFRFMVRGGNGSDGDVPGLSDAVASMLTRGTAKLTSQQFSEQIDFVGGTIVANADADAVNIVAGGLKKHMPVILDLLSQAIISPKFDDGELTKYKQQQITGLKSSKAESSFLATYAVNKVLFGASAYGQMPTEEAYGRMTPKMLNDYYARFIIPGNTTLAFVGDITAVELKQKLEDALKDWKGGTSTLAMPPNVPVTGRRIVLVDRPASVQSSIRVIANGPQYNDPERPMTSVLNSILGGGTGLGNRLAMNLRETHSYTYSPYSYFTANSIKGYFSAEADVRNSVTDSALKEMLFEINRMKTEPVSDGELQRNIQSVAGQFLMSIPKADITASRVQFIDFYGLPKDYYNRLIGVYNSTTAKDVQRLAAKFINVDNLAIVVVGKASEVRSKLEQFGPVEVWDTDLNPATEPSAGAIDMSADEVWAKMLTAMGGADKMRAVKSMKTVMTIAGTAGPQQISGTMTKIEGAPNKQYMMVDLGVFRQESFCDGKKVTAKTNGKPQPVSDEDLAKALENNQMFNEAYIKELGGRLTLKGVKLKDGRKAIVVELNLPKNGSSTYYVDGTTFLPFIQEGPKGDVVKLDDWKAESGIMLPHAVTIEPQPGVTLKTTNIVYSVNLKVTDAMFKAK